MTHFSSYGRDRYGADPLPPLPPAVRAHIVALREDERERGEEALDRWEVLWWQARCLPLAELEAMEPRLRQDLDAARGPFVAALRAAVLLPEDATAADAAETAERYIVPADAYFDADARLHVNAVARRLVEAYGDGYLEREEWTWPDAETHDVGAKWQPEPEPSAVWDAYEGKHRELPDDDTQRRQKAEAHAAAWRFAVTCVERCQIVDLRAFVDELARETERATSAVVEAAKLHRTARLQLSRHRGNDYVRAGREAWAERLRLEHVAALHNQGLLQYRHTAAETVLRRFLAGLSLGSDAQEAEAKAAVVKKRGRPRAAAWQRAEVVCALVDAHLQSGENKTNAIALAAEAYSERYPEDRLTESTIKRIWQDQQ